MTVGNIVTWPWYLAQSSPPRLEQTQRQGLIVNSRFCKTDFEKIILFSVLLTDGTLCEVREDEAGLELVA